MFHRAIGKRWNGSAESKNLSMRINFNRENREIPEISASASNHAIVERSENACGGTADMHVSGKSDDFVVPTKLATKTGTPVAESMEGRRSPKSPISLVSLLHMVLNLPRSRARMVITFVPRVWVWNFVTFLRATAEQDYGSESPDFIRMAPTPKPGTTWILAAKT
jgi:hypothetical protein